MLDRCLSLIKLNFYYSKLHIRNATLAGGIGVGCIADLPMQPVGALVVGFFCGAVSTLSYEYVMPCLNQFHINDSCKRKIKHTFIYIFSNLNRIYLYFFKIKLELVVCLVCHP